MYAVINSGGKQYRLREGELLHLERLDGEIGDQVVFDQVLLVGNDGSPLVGTPTVDGARVVGTIVEQGKGDKIVVFKFKKRKMYRRRTGHRQLLTTVKIDSIETGGKVKPKPEAKQESAPAEKRKPAAKAAAKKTAKTDTGTTKVKKEAAGSVKAKKAEEKESKKTPKKPSAKARSTKAGTKRKASAAADPDKAKAELRSKKSDAEKETE